MVDEDGVGSVSVGDLKARRDTPLKYILAVELLYS